MSDRTAATGFESAFIESYEGWEEIEVACLLFLGCKVRSLFDIPTNKLYDVLVTMDSNSVEIQTLEGDVVYSGKFDLVLRK